MVEQVESWIETRGIMDIIGDLNDHGPNKRNTRNHGYKDLAANSVT